MRLGKLAKLAALCCGVTASAAYGQELQQPIQVAPEPVAEYHVPSSSYESYPVSDDYCCDSGCDSCDGGCDSGGCCGGGILTDGFGSLGCDEPLGDPFRVFGHCKTFSVGGWTQFGYHDKNLPLFNSRKNDVQLQQAWIYAEKALDTSCGFDFGGRVDYIYGTDGPDTQAFGIDNGHWDNNWDNGADYGSAIPQLYLEAGYKDVSVKVGHFFTIIGYEVVPAPDNFFYSHAYTMYNSEPFTHTGALATVEACDDVTLYGGWTLGWDSGFEDNGDAYLGGASLDLTEDISWTTTFTAGRFSDNLQSQERGWMVSNVAQIQLNNRLRWIIQNDWLDTEDAAGQTFRDTVGINQYLLQDLCDRLAIGCRVEWWHVNGDSRGYYPDGIPANETLSGNLNIYEVTCGLNYRPCANVIVRPEIRWDWVFGPRDEISQAGDEILEGNAKTQTTFGMDAILLF